ncbi:FAD-dependent monooxygenase [Amnibacterium soli]|uniref:FAD-dependent monooxygenase n=1 Tax=Amnibacterium soli TaxID=1282736 RepID=UPI0031F0F017
MPPTHVLITGASIAGPSLAFWLHRAGIRATIVERAPAFRSGGQNIDVRGVAREVLRRAGLEDAVAAATTGERGTRFVSADDSSLAEFPVTGSETDGPTAGMEVLRGDLARILLDAVQADVEIVHGDRVAAMHEDADGVAVEFEHGAPRRFDLVVAADGLRSSTRALAFDDVRIRSLGLEMSYLTVPRTAADDDWWRWYPAAGGGSANLRPDRHGTMRALLTETTDDRGEHPAAERRGASTRSAAEQRAHLRRRFAGAGWESERILAALDDAGDLYFESIGQVKAPRWSSGRIALTGDAAWCASPVSGMGTSLGLVGAYVLAGELASSDDHRAAFAAYERRMRPYVERGQDLPPGTPQLANPRSRPGLALLRTVLRAAGTPPVRAAIGRLFAPPADEFALPDYPRLQRVA